MFNRNLLLAVLTIFCLAMQNYLIAIAGLLIVFTFFNDIIKYRNGLGTLIFLSPAFLLSIFVWVHFSLLGLQTFLIALMFIVNIFFIIYYHS
jgi:hypothetical protein